MHGCQYDESNPFPPSSVDPPESASGATPMEGDVAMSDQDPEYLMFQQEQMSNNAILPPPPPPPPPPAHQLDSAAARYTITNLDGGENSVAATSDAVS